MRLHELRLVDDFARQIHGLLITYVKGEKVYYKTKDFVEIKDGEMIPTEAVIPLPQGAEQELIDQLWKRGFRPHNVQTTSEVIDAKQAQINSQDNMILWFQQAMDNLLK